MTTRYCLKRYLTKCDSHYGGRPTLIVHSLTDSFSGEQINHCWRCRWLQQPVWWAKVKTRTFMFLSGDREPF